jgi:hypothetical protein
MLFKRFQLYRYVEDREVGGHAMLAELERGGDCTS